MSRVRWPAWGWQLWAGLCQGLCQAGPFLAMHNNGMAVPATADVSGGSPASRGV